MPSREREPLASCSSCLKRPCGWMFEIRLTLKRILPAGPAISDTYWTAFTATYRLRLRPTMRERHEWNGTRPCHRSTKRGVMSRKCFAFIASMTNDALRTHPQYDPFPLRLGPGL